MPSQIGIHLSPQSGQSFREVDKAVVFLAITLGCPIGMISILLAAFEIPPGGLYVACGIGRNPDIRPRRRDSERANTLDGFSLAGFVSF